MVATEGTADEGPADEGIAATARATADEGTTATERARTDVGSTAIPSTTEGTAGDGAHTSTLFDQLILVSPFEQSARHLIQFCMMRVGKTNTHTGWNSPSAHSGRTPAGTAHQHTHKPDGCLWRVWQWPLLLIWSWEFHPARAPI